jgi:hypothetical protein
MPKYVIERDLPGAGDLSAEQLQSISEKSNLVIGELGPEIRWLTSYTASMSRPTRTSSRSMPGAADSPWTASPWCPPSSTPPRVSDDGSDPVLGVPTSVGS